MRWDEMRWDETRWDDEDHKGDDERRFGWSRYRSLNRSSGGAEEEVYKFNSVGEFGALKTATRRIPCCTQVHNKKTETDSAARFVPDEFIQWNRKQVFWDSIMFKIRISSVSSEVRFIIVLQPRWILSPVNIPVISINFSSCDQFVPLQVSKLLRSYSCLNASRVLLVLLWCLVWCLVWYETAFGVCQLNEIGMDCRWHEVKTWHASAGWQLSTQRQFPSIRNSISQHHHHDSGNNCQMPLLHSIASKSVLLF